VACTLVLCECVPLLVAIVGKDGILEMGSVITNYSYASGRIWFLSEKVMFD
jgi:hypothetical protein